MNDRRRFVRNFGLLGAVLGGMGVSEAATRGISSLNRVPDSNRDGDPISTTHLQPSGDTKITIHSYNQPKNRTIYPGPGYTVNVGTGSQAFVVVEQPRLEEQNKVNLSVGKDNRLWVEVDGKWRRVALEA